MALYAIGDLHLSLGTDKPMDVFGGRWENYVEKIKEGFSELNDDDLTVICGDISWGMSIDETLEDFKFIDRLPGKKIILKGNHDYWWTTATKAKKFFAEHGITTIDILHNNCFKYENLALCGTRGWFYEESKGDEHDKKVMNREIMRLDASLKAAGEGEKYAFLHYPPKYYNYECPEILELLRKYDVRRCIYGHIHGPGCAFAFNGMYGSTKFDLVSADYIQFKPKKLL